MQGKRPLWAWACVLQDEPAQFSGVLYAAERFSDFVFLDGTEKFWYSRQTGGAGMMFTGSYASPLGGMTMASDGTALTGLWFDGQKYFGSGFLREKKEKNLPIFDQTTRWLDLYFSGEVPDFTPLLSAAGTPFQKTVWAVLLTIPYGQTRTYGEIASVIAKERRIPRLSAQAVGGAVGHNPISLVIPCHRVIGANGRLTGYAGGLDKKEKLLSLEQNGKKMEYVQHSHEKDYRLSE